MRVLVPVTLAIVIGVLVTPVIAVAFLLLDANESNSLVATVMTVADNLVEPFRGIFTPDQPELADGLAWGLAGAVYLIVAGAVSTVFKKSH